jgi:hypothetical protein
VVKPIEIDTAFHKSDSFIDFTMLQKPAPDFLVLYKVEIDHVATTPIIGDVPDRVEEEIRNPELGKLGP